MDGWDILLSLLLTFYFCPFWKNVNQLFLALWLYLTPLSYLLHNENTPSFIAYPRLELTSQQKASFPFLQKFRVRIQTSTEYKNRFGGTKKEDENSSFHWLWLSPLEKWQYSDFGHGIFIWWYKERDWHGQRIWCLIRIQSFWSTTVVSIYHYNVY